ncbi:DUF2577 family protein [Paenibacillus sp. MWE-103]|uniref:DUF2577 family protein n=1 Tax=Paenibacillus artemisiicola TaxID=1172618 RepID=A0ABS3WG91_9BACL|nr:DUF2577 family protein [Paenibacillus artemisiicola]MBO7747347.1 DUF2577 family protein [Paenibacillus artemisiicola]
MKPWAVGVARLLKERDNKPPSGVALATVISPLPEMSLSLTDDIILDTADLIVASRLYELELQAGDVVIVLPSEGGQIYYVMDKVGR